MLYILLGELMSHLPQRLYVLCDIIKDGIRRDSGMIVWHALLMISDS